MTNFNQSDYLVKWTFLRYNNKIIYNGEQHSMFTKEEYKIIVIF